MNKEHGIKVSIKIIENPFKTFYDINNTLDDYVNMYTAAGCSEEFIERLKNFFEKREKHHINAATHFDSVMSRYSGKVSTKTKKSSIRKRFAKTLKTKTLEDCMENGV